MKITKKQIKELEKNVVSKLYNRFHDSCPKTLSGVHKWVRQERHTGYGSPRRYYKHLGCNYCGMWKV